MAYIEKRKLPNGGFSYRARIRIQGMPDESASFPTRTLAKEWAQRREAEKKASRYFLRDEGKRKTFASFVDLYIQKSLPKNPKAYSKQLQLMLWWRSMLGNYYLCHISPSMIAELRDELLTQTTRLDKVRSPSTVNRYLAALSRAFTICIKEFGWLKENPVALITRPRESKGRERYLSKEEIERLFEACRDSRSQHLASVVHFALATGARRGEILNLKWQDVDFVQRIAIFHHTKNGEKRGVSLTSSLIECLQQERKKRCILSPFIFASADGKKAADISGAWRYVVRRAGLNNFRFHDLRHTTASYLAMSGASTLEIAAILGHKTLAMVKRYSHLSTSFTASALNRVNEVMFSA